MPVTALPTVRAALPPVADTSVAFHVGDPGVLVNEKRSPQLAAWPSMVTWVAVVLTKIEPLNGGAPDAAPVTFVADHAGELMIVVEVGPGIDVIGEPKSSALPLLESAAMSTAVAS